MIDRVDLCDTEPSSTPVVPDPGFVVIERLTPEIDGGRYPIKRVIGDTLAVEADIFAHGHTRLRAQLLIRHADADAWDASEMKSETGPHLGGIGSAVRCRAHVRVERLGLYYYTITGWHDHFLSWRDDLEKRVGAGQATPSDFLDGTVLLNACIARQMAPDDAAYIESYIRMLTDLARDIDHVDQNISTSAATDSLLVELQDQRLDNLTRDHGDRSEYGRYPRVLQLIVDRRAAEFGAWYEMWPRSQGTTPAVSATFHDMAARLPDIRSMGFDVIYLPPIHPIGYTNRKGANNSAPAATDDPGCPFAIGNAHGGHDAVHPELGNLDDFDKFVATCTEQGMEVAMDYALQTSPDHPWVSEHPRWFRRRADGTIRYAENPPKKYEDIYPLDFANSDRSGLWFACRDIIRFWIAHGVHIFRVDNPHTKPLGFWRWLIATIREEAPETIFLAEAFTRPEMMQALANVGFSQSYTYFTWRNRKDELRSYFSDLMTGVAAETLRGNLFTNTPDILPYILQDASPAAFAMRATLAATLSSLWGIYNGFELCEGRALQGKEEYADSEKYQYKVWDWNRSGNIKGYIRQLNAIRAQHPALQHYRNLSFCDTESDFIIAYTKIDARRSDRLLIVTNLDPDHVQEGIVHVPLDRLGLCDLNARYEVKDLLSHKIYTWSGSRNYVRLDPAERVAHIFEVNPAHPRG